MPCIHRIRIINFSCNNDARHILDETFHFHGGENALLNLANGGGKSVLVQLILQPIVPRAKIQNRPIADFFRKKKTPAYVLVEWKLDGAGGYLLTGIAIAPVENRAADEDDKGRIRLFCFLCRYTQVNEYDLANIDLIRKEDGLLHITPYKQVQEMMQEARRKDPLNISYFPQDELEDHRRKLVQYGISQDEWKHVLVRINDSEGGLEEIFSKCKTSDQLLNEWLIRTVEKGLSPSGKSSSDEKDLQQMFENLLKDTLNSEAFLQEKHVLASFSPRFDGLKENTSTLAKLLESVGDSESRLAAFHVWLSRQEMDKNAACVEAKEELDGFPLQYTRIEQEERSADYHAAYEAWAQADEKYRKADKAQNIAKSAFDEISQQLLLMQAARIRQEINIYETRIATLEEQKRNLESDQETTGKIDRLKASLHIRWQERASLHAAKREELEKQEDEQKNEQERIKDSIVQLEKRIKELRNEQDKRKSHIDIYTAQEEKLMKELGVNPVRNLAGELSEQESSRITASLGKRLLDAGKIKQSLLQEETILNKDILNIDDQLTILKGAEQDFEKQQNQLEMALTKYHEKTEEYRKAMKENGLPENSEKEKALNELNRRYSELQNRISANERELHVLSALAEDLRFGRFHVQSEWLQYLSDANIAYQTGEDYLRRLNTQARELILQKIPLLPYAILLAPEDLKILPETMRSEVRRGVAPIMTYEALKSGITGSTGEVFTAEPTDSAGSTDITSLREPNTAEKTGMDETEVQTATSGPWDGRAVELSKNTVLAALYNRDALDPETTGCIMEETQNKCNELKASVENLREANMRLAKDIQIVESYPYEPSWKDTQETILKRVTQALEENRELQKEAGRDKRDKESRRLELLGKLIPKADTVWKKAENNLHQWEEHLTGNTTYEENYRRWADNNQQISQIDNEIKRNRNTIDVLTKKIDAQKEALLQSRIHEKESLDRLSKYAGFNLKAGQEPEIGTCIELEAQLQEILNAQGREQQVIENRIKELRAEKLNQEQKWRRLKVPENIELPLYDETSEEALEDRKPLLHTEYERCRTLAEQTKIEEASKKTSLNNAHVELERTGLSEPLPVTGIFGNYRQRRIELKNRETALRNRIDNLKIQLTNFSTSKQRISDELNLNAVKLSTQLVVADDWNTQLDSILSALKMSRNKVTREKEEFTREYDKVRSEYAEKSELLQKLFEGLDAMQERASDSYEPFYYLYERMEEHSVILQQQISMLNARLENLDKSRSDVVQHCWFHGAKIYEELRRIEQASSVRLEGRVTPVSMLKVQMDLDSTENARQRIQFHVEKSVQDIREEFRSGKSQKEIQNSIERLIQSRELLNVYLGTTRIPVQVFKIDLNMANSRMKVWEDAIRENSGGEKFVVYFSVLSALMAYTRSSEQAAQNQAGGGTTKTGRRVLIMDNPFGPISSQHLLQPLFEIAKKHQTQMICLTDLKQSSILNNFNLVYMLRVRKAAASNNEYLKFEQYKRSDNVAEVDESLEKAFYRVSDFKQMQFFED
jgi:hypothetical protein